MAIEATASSLKEMNEYMKTAIKRADTIILRNLQRLGEMAIIKARDRSGAESWYDQTGNLRSSIGYIIGKDGVVQGQGGFSTVLSGSQGPLEGRELAMSLAEDMSGKYFLIVVAGMKYASYVEDMENKDVLASTSLFVQKEVPKMMKRIDKMLSEKK